MHLPDPQERQAFRSLIRENEEWLMRRTLEYAERHAYTKYTSTLLEAWRISIEGLTDSLCALMENSPEVPELGPDQDFSRDPACKFGMVEARKHRSRGVNLSMFLGLFKYYRQSYMDLLEGERERFPSFPFFRLYLERFFDRTEVAYCTEWAGMDPEAQIKELSAANLAMANEKNKYLTVFDSVGSPVVLIDREGYIENMNLAAGKVFRKTVIPGKSYYDEGAPKEKFAWLEGELEQLIASGESETAFEKAYPDGEDSTIFTVRLQRLHDISKKFVGYTALLGDITEIRRAEEKLREVDRLKSDFISSMSHELRTPMNAILGFVELMGRDGTLNPETAEHLAIVHRSGEYLLSLINDVLDMSKIEAGKGSVENSGFNLHALLGNIEEMMGVKALEKGLLFQLVRDPALPPCPGSPRKRWKGTGDGGGSPAWPRASPGSGCWRWTITKPTGSCSASSWKRWASRWRPPPTARKPWSGSAPKGRTWSGWTCGCPSWTVTTRRSPCGGKKGAKR